jgi:hypothetical protein
MTNWKDQKDHRVGSDFLKKHPKPAQAKPKCKRLEHWKAAKNRNWQERNELATPLLKGVSETEASRLIRKT